MSDGDGVEDPDRSCQTDPCTLWEDPTFRPICCCRIDVTSEIHPLLTQGGWGHTTISRLSPAPFKWAAPVLQRTLLISQGSNSTVWLSSSPIRLHYLSLQESRSWHRHNDKHVHFFNPLQIHHAFSRVYEYAGLDWDKDDSFHTILKPVSLISSLSASDHRNHLK